MKRWLGLGVLWLFVALAFIGGVFYFRPLWVGDQILRYNMWKQGVRSDYIEIGGHRIHYVEAGTYDGKPLVLVHGLGSRIEDWAPLIPRFASAGYHVYAMDLLGYGRSAKPEDMAYTIAEEEQLVAQFMDAMHIAQADVAGWSMGGWISMKLAVDHPEKVRRLVLYDTAGLYFGVDFSFDWFTPKSLEEVGSLLRVLEPNPTKIPDFAARDVVRRAKANGWVVQRSIHTMTIGRELMDFRLGGLKQPTLIMWGRNDHLIPLSTGQRLHQMLPQSRFEVVDGCGHLAPRECVDSFFNATVDYLKSEPPTIGEREWPAPAKP